MRSSAKKICISFVMLVLMFSFSGCGAGKTPEDKIIKAEILIEKAKAEINDRNFRTAIDDLKEAVRADPKNPNAHYYLAVTYILIKYPVNNIIKEFKRSVLIDPNFKKGNRELGIIYTNLGKHEKGMWYLKKAIALDPKDSISIENLGYAYYMQKKYDEAEKQYNLAAKLNSESTNLWNNLGLLYMDRGEMDQAHNAFMRSLSIKPKQSDPYKYLAVIEKQRGDAGQVEYYTLMAGKYRKNKGDQKDVQENE